MPRSLLAGAACAVVLTVSSIPGSANGVSARPTNTWTSGGSVITAIEHGGVVYLGGTFRSFGQPTSALIALDRATNRPTDWPGIQMASVSHLLADPDGGYLVRGQSSVDGRLVPRFVRLTAGGQVDPGFQWAVDDPRVDVAILAGDRLVVSDYGFQAGRSAIVDRRTGRMLSGLLPFVTWGGGTGPGGALIVWASSASQSGVAELHPTSGAIVRVIFTPPAGFSISALTVTGAHAFIATSADGSGPTSGHVVEVDLNTGLARALATVAGLPGGGRVSPRRPPVTTIVNHRGRLYLHGNLTEVNGTVLPPTATDAAAIDAATGALTAWRRADWARGTLLAGDGERLLFSTGSYQPPALPKGGGPALFALDAESGADTGWWAPLLTDTEPRAVVLPEPGRLVVAGPFFGMGTLLRTGLAAITLPDGRPTTWNPPQAEDTFALAASGTRMFAVHSWGGRIAEYDAVTGERASWTAEASGEIRRIVVAGQRLFVAGDFTALDGQPRHGAASFDLGASPPTLEPWTPALVPTSVSAIYVLPQAVLLAGAFPAGPAGPVHRLIAVDPVSGAVLPWLPVFDEWGRVWDIDGTADRIFVAGPFSTVNGQPLRHVAAFDLGGRLLPWQLQDAADIVLSSALTLFEDRLYLTGSPPVVVAFDLATGHRTAWQPEVSSNAFVPVPGLGILGHGLTTGYFFYPRVPSLSPVTGLRGAVDGAVVQLSWNASDHADSYVIEAGDAPGASNLASLDTRSAGTTFSAPVANGRYFVRVRGRNEDGPGPPSNELVIVVGEGACAAAPESPTSLQATVAGLTATFTWQPPASGAVVMRYAVDLVSGPGSPATLARVAGTTLSGSGPPGTYAVAVRAENGCGSSAPTPAVAVTLPSS